jgi:phosphate transport system permease protein
VSSIEAKTGSPKRRLGDLVFANLTRSAAVLILLSLAGVAIFLTPYSRWRSRCRWPSASP